MSVSLPVCLPAQVGCGVRNLITDSVHVWDLDTLRNRVSLMHDQYHAALQGQLHDVTGGDDGHGKTLSQQLADDPFYDPHVLQYSGRAVVLTKSLLTEPYAADMTVPVYNDKARLLRCLLCVACCDV